MPADKNALSASTIIFDSPTLSRHDYETLFCSMHVNGTLFVREHGVHAGPKDYFVVVVVVVICG
jgi:hypothetical protein